MLHVHPTTGGTSDFVKTPERQPDAVVAKGASDQLRNATEINQIPAILKKLNKQPKRHAPCTHSNLETQTYR